MIPYLFSLLSGVLYVVSFAPWNQSYLQWIAFTPLLFITLKLADQNPSQSSKKLFKLGFLMAAVICAGGFYWIMYAVKQYGGLPDIAAFLLFLAFCCIGQLQIPFFFFIRARLFQRLSLAYAIPLSGFLYAGLESFLPKVFLDTAGNAFYIDRYARQVADLGGPFLLTTLILIVCELFAQSLLQQKLKRRLGFSAIALAIIASVYAYGNFRLNQISTLQAQAKSTPALKLAMIQANIGDFLKIAAEHGNQNATSEVMNQYLGMSALATKDSPDAIVWPETAYPALFLKPMTAPERQAETSLLNFANGFSGTMIFGGYDQEKQDDFNSLFFYRSHDQSHAGSDQKPELKTYHKSILLMFGETLPFAEQFPQMRNWFPNMGFFGRGPGAQIIDVVNASGQNFKLAPSICYEGLITDHSVKGSLLGADALINVTNDSWFGPYGEPYLHLALTVFRSIETRIPMIRSTNTGITTLIDETGELTQKTEVMSATTVPVQIHSRNTPESPYVTMSRLFGTEWFSRLCELLTLGMLVLCWKRKRNSFH